MQHVRDTGLLHVQNLSSNRQQGLILAVSSELRRAQRGVTLHDKQLRVCNFIASAVHEFGGKARRFQRALAPLRLLQGSRRNATLHFRNNLFEQQRALGLVIPLAGCQSLRQRLGHHIGHNLLDRWRAENFFRLAFKLGLRQAHGDHRSQTSDNVILLELVVSGLESTRIGLDLGAKHLVQRLLKTALVSSTLWRRDDVHKRVDARVISRAPSHGDINRTRALNFLW